MDFELLEKNCKECKKCGLYKTRTNTVFGRGNQTASLLFVGEAPGEKEDLSGKPFVGAAGKLLDKYLEAVGISTDDYYITNTVKCRPPQNRDPLPEEQEACKEFLRAQVQEIKPKLIVCLGRIAAMRLIKPDFRITAEHGKLFKLGDHIICAVYHPAAILRDPRKKEDMLEDMKNIKKLLDRERAE